LKHLIFFPLALLVVGFLYHFLTMNEHKVIIRFTLEHQVRHGQFVSLLGSTSFMGNWQVDQAKGMLWQPAHWYKQIVVKEDVDVFEYKYVVMGHGQIVWERTENRTVHLKELVKELVKGEKAFTVVVHVHDVWEKPREADAIMVKEVSPQLRDTTAIIVLGKKLLPNGEPTEMLKERIQAAAEVSRSIQNYVIVVTGGIVQHCGISEAQVMKTLLINEGISEIKVILEDKALTTVQNALYTYDLLHELGINKVVVVTASFHMERSKKIFNIVFRDGFLLEYVTHNPGLTHAQFKHEMDVERRMIATVEEDLRLFIN